MLHRYLSLALFIFCCLPSLVLGWCKENTFKTGREIRAMAISPSGRYLVLAHNDNKVRFYHGFNYLEVGEYTVAYSINVIRFSNDGNYLAIGGDASSVTIINGYEPFGFNTTVTANIGSNVYGMDFSNDSTRFVACGGNGNGAGKINLFAVSHTSAWTSVSGAVNMNPASSTPNDCRISPFDGRVAVNINSKISIYTATLTTPIQYTPGSTTYSKMAFDPLKTNILYIDLDGNQFFDLFYMNGTAVHLTSPTTILRAVDFASNGKYFATGGDARILYVYDANRALQARWDTTGIIRAVSFNRLPINQKLFAGDATGQVLVLSFNCSGRSCPSDHFLDSSGCRFCGDVMPKCINCVNQTICDRCVSGYFVNPNTYQCSPCTMFGCFTCSMVNNCTECHSGFYSVTANNLTTCRRCSAGDTGMDGCAICNSSSICIACNNDFYLENNKCKLCTNITNCLKCNNGSFCMQCVNGYFSDAAGVCTVCDVNCLACQGSATNCTQCAKGWRVNPPTSYTCTRCQTGCLSCNNTDFCFECQNSMYEKTDGSCGLCVYPCLNCESDTLCNACAEGYYLSGTSCVACTNNCATCNSSAYCTSCLAGFHIATGNTCKACVQTYGFCEYCTSSACQFCQPGYFLNSSTLCQHCSEKMFKCQRCTSDTDCISCIEGFYLTGSAGNASCKSCEVGCQTCIDSGDCRKCYKQYYLDANDDCIACMGNCLECSDGPTCTLCDQGYYLDGVTCKTCKTNLTNCLRCHSGTVCQNCEIGFYLDSGDSKCKPCANNCITCDQGKCFSCKIGYYLTTATFPTCQPCSQICTQCTSPTSCTSCKSGFFLDTNTFKNCTINNRYCRTCNINDCFSCVYGYYLDSAVSPPNIKCTRCLQQMEGCLHCNASNQCLACDNGYYLESGTNLCVGCDQINGCQKCSSSAVCLQCGLGFYLNSTDKCESCKTGCTTCDASGTCYVCSPGFYYSTGDCVPCNRDMEGCSLCSVSNTCSQCLNGYYLDGSTFQCSLCKNTLSGCLYCNSSSICTNCQPGYFVDNSNNNCKACDKTMLGCEICSASNVCVDCGLGYYLTGGGGSGCTPCISDLPGCVSCTDIDTCVICKTGFYLHSDNKCHKCNSINTGCQSCAVSTGSLQCLQCSSGYFIQPVTKLCSPCYTLGCQICDQTNPLICITCDSMYYKNASSCQKCGSVIEGCYQCQNDTQCTSCDVGYYLDTSGLCKLCQEQLNGCSKCQLSIGVIQCQQCKSSYILDNSTKQCLSCSAVMEGCTYCINSTQCISCSNGYFKDTTTKLCRSCVEQDGCLLCSDQLTCEYCSPSYFLDNALGKCVKCSQVIQFCSTCLQATRCLSCQSGYFVNEKYECEQVTVLATQKVEGVKLIIEFVDQDTLSHTLMVSNNQYSNVGFDMTGMCTLYLTDYNQLSAAKKIVQIQLLIKSVRWLSPTKIQFLTNNPTSLNTDTMSMRRRLQANDSNNGQSQSQRTRLLSASSGEMGNFKVSLEMTQSAVNTILPNLYQTGDLVLDYSLDEPEFYMSVMRNTDSDAGYFMFYGYTVIAVLLINFMVKTYKQPSPQNSHHWTGEVLGHVLAFKCIALFQYPITMEFYYFCFGFMVLDLPWLNFYTGQTFGERSDFVPKQLALFYYNLNLASTYLLALAAFVLLFCLRFAISKKKELARDKYTQLVLNTFLFGLTFAGCLSLQGAKFNPIQRLSLSAIFYLLGILAYLLLFVYLLYSLYQNKQSFYQLRIFLKATLLSLAHLNPIILVSVSIILDILLVILQFIVVQKDLAWNKIWLVNHLLLNMALAFIFLLPNSAPSLYGAMAIIGIVTFMEVLLNIKLMAFCQQRAKLQKNKDEEPSQHIIPNGALGLTMNQSMETFMDDKEQAKFDFWNIDNLKDAGSLNDIANYEQKVLSVKKDFYEGGESKYISFMGGFDERSPAKDQQINRQLEGNKKIQEPNRIKEPRSRENQKKGSSKQLSSKKLRVTNPFKIQSSSSSPTEEQVASRQEKQKRNSQSHFITSNTRQKRRSHFLS